MIKQFVKGRTYVFIDAANLFYCQRTLGWKIAYAKLMKYFKEECGENVKCFIYAAYNENRQQEQKFLDMLDINGYILRTKALKEISIAEDKNKHKGSLDVELALEMVELIDKYDTVILVSGDSDFAPPLDRAKKKEKQIIIMSTKGHISRELLCIGKYINLKKLKNELSKG